MKIALFVDDLEPSGVVVNAIALASAFAGRGWDVALVAARATGALRGSVPEPVAVTSLVAGQHQASRKRRMRRAIRPLRAYLRSERPDVLLSVGNQGHAAAAIASLGLPTRLVVRISNDLAHDRSGISPRQLWARGKLHFVAARSTRMVFVSDQLLAAARGRVPAIGGKGLVIPNGVDRETVRKRASESLAHPWFPDRARPVVVAVGRLVEQKNFATLLDAIAIAGETSPMRLLIVGAGPLREALRTQAKALGIAEDVQILPPVPNPLPLMAAADVIALPSFWEGASNVLLEALALERPIVASRTAGSAAEVLDNGRFGLLVDPHNAGEIAVALLRQTSSDAVRPGSRSASYDRTATLSAYAGLIAELAP